MKGDPPSVDHVTLVRRQRLGMLGLGIMLAAIVLAAVAAGAEPFLPDALGPGQDARAYWEATRAELPYEREVGDQSAYLYSPAFLQGVSPLTVLSWESFLVGWTGVALAAALVLAGPLLFAPVLFFASFEVWGGNVHLLLALAIVAGFRWPAAWALVLLTKITPGIGLLWFATRREWRPLGIALGATAAVAGVSWLVDPILWQQWFTFLLGSLGQSTPAGGIPVPIWVRLPMAAAVTVYAARTDRQWLVLVAAVLALPVLWWGGLSMLVGIVALRRREFEAGLMGLLTRPQVAPSTRLARAAVPEGS